MCVILHVEEVVETKPGSNNFTAKVTKLEKKVRNLTGLMKDLRLQIDTLECQVSELSRFVHENEDDFVDWEHDYDG